MPSVQVSRTRQVRRTKNEIRLMDAAAGIKTQTKRQDDRYETTKRELATVAPARTAAEVRADILNANSGLGGVLRAREIVHAGGFGPEDFALLDAVFQAAWHHIEIKCVEGDRKASRERLASIVVALAQARGVLESEALEKAAVEMFDRRP